MVTCNTCWHLLSRLHRHFRIVPTCQVASECPVHFALKTGKVGRSFASGAQSFFEMQRTAQCNRMKCWRERHGQTMPATLELKNWRTCATNGCCFMAPPLQQLWLFPEVTSESTLQEAVLEHCMAEGRTWQNHLPKLMSIRSRRVESMLCWSFAPWVVMCATVTRWSQMPKTWHKAVSKAPMIVFLEIARSVEVHTGSLSFSTLKTCTLNTFSFTSVPPSRGKKDLPPLWLVRGTSWTCSCCALLCASFSIPAYPCISYASSSLSLSENGFIMVHWCCERLGRFGGSTMNSMNMQKSRTEIDPSNGASAQWYNNSGCLTFSLQEVHGGTLILDARHAWRILKMCKSIVYNINILHELHPPKQTYFQRKKQFYG